jgi:hypothetical protein
METQAKAGVTHITVEPEHGTDGFVRGDDEARGKRAGKGKEKGRKKRKEKKKEGKKKWMVEGFRFFFPWC